MPLTYTIPGQDAASVAAQYGIDPAVLAQAVADYSAANPTTPATPSAPASPYPGYTFKPFSPEQEAALGKLSNSVSGNLAGGGYFVDANGNTLNDASGKPYAMDQYGHDLGWFASLPNADYSKDGEKVLNLALLAMAGGTAAGLAGVGGAAAGGVGDVGNALAGGSGVGSAAGGAGTVLSPYEAAGGSIYGSGAAGGLGDSVIAVGGTGAVPGAVAGAGAAGNALAGSGNMIDPALAQDVYGGMIDPAIQPITMPPGATPLPSTIPTTPIDPSASLQPMPSPPAGLTTPPIPTSAGGTTPTTPSTPTTPGASDVPDWLKALVPGLDALGQYITAGKASDAQAAAYQAAIDEQKREYDQTRSDYAPYLKTGTDALGRLNSLSSGDMSSFQLSPDYNFRQQQGTQGIENQFSASGGALSGNALKALNEFNSNLASGEYGNYWNRQSSLAGLGQTATGQVSQLGQNNANNTGNALIGQGDARGTGLAGQYGAFGNLANSLYRNFYPNFAGRP